MINSINSNTINNNTNYCMASNGNCRPVGDGICCYSAFYNECPKNDCENCNFASPKCKQSSPCWDCLHSDCSHCGDARYPAGELYVGIVE